MTVKKSDKITVIVPCYNVENYLARCLDSLLVQTHTNFEVIMVEDCSTDGTKEVVEKYEKKYDNFKAIYNEKNGGLGNARNVGIDTVRSPYVVFLDSDDWLPENFLAEMHRTLTENDADISICDIYLRYDDSRKDQRVVSYNPKPDKYGLINTSMAASSSNKLFKSELFSTLKYPVGIVNEDIPVTLCLLGRNKVAYTKDTHFNYYQRDGSIQNSQVTRRRLEVFKAVALLRKNSEGKIDDKIWEVVVWHQILAVLIFVLPRVRGVLSRRALIKEFHALAVENSIDISRDNSGFREFSKNSRAYKVYGSWTISLVRRRHFLAAGLLMSVYSFLAKNKGLVRFMVRLAKFLRFMILHPLSFIRVYGGRIKHRIFRKVVINTNITMRDVVATARKQSELTSLDLVSVVIPNYNYERFLLQRVYSILTQTEKIGEILILDDCSTDDSVSLAEDIKKKINKYVPIRTINNKKNAGTFRQWERGFKKAKYDYIWIAEADDYCGSEFLQYALGPLVQDSNVVISYTNTGYTDGAGVLTGNVKKDIDYQGSGHWDGDYINSGFEEANQYSYLNNTIANVSSVVFRRKTDLEYSRLFAEARKYRQAGDWVFYVNYMLHGDIAYTDKVINYYRVHGNNVSSTTKAQDHIDEILEVHKYFARKLKLNSQQTNKMAQRRAMLRKAWSL